jgi:hypothetical protein
MASRTACVVVCGALVAASGYPRAQSAAPPASQPRLAPAPPAPEIQPLLSQYCVTCHNARLKTAGLAIDQLDLARVDQHAETWEKVARKLRTHEMPPPGTPRPDKAAYERAAAALEAALDAAAAARPQPGRVAVHRLNRTEYANAIRDLLALDVDVKTLLPADEPDQQGFDNMASVLSVSPRLLENYLSAAAVVSRLAVGDANASPTEDTFRVPTAMVQDDRASDDLPFGSRGGLSVRYQFPVDGEYGIKVLLRRQLYLYLIGMGEAQQIDIRLDGALVKRFSVGGEGKGATAPESFAGNTQGDPQWEVYMHTADDGLSVRVPVKAGTHRVGVSFVRRAWEPEGILQLPQRGFARTTNELYFGDAAVESVAIAGPYRPMVRDDTASRRAVFVCRTPSPASEEACARRILARLARRAYRRPVSAADLEPLMAFYRAGRAEDSFDGGIQRGLRRLLSSPTFLFRVEAVPAAVRPGQAYQISDIDLASRLSFFLWSSVPDDELLNLAARNALSSPMALERQVRRMLADPRASALVENFASQWLLLGKLAGLVPDADAYPEFDENLRDAFRRETQLFVADQLRRDRGVPELVTADYSFINERLARHYGIRNVYGSHFRRLTFPDGTRGGLLGQGSVLAVTSYPNRTSPVVRGRWLLENVLGAPPPAPPPDVPSLQANPAAGRPTSIREQMEAHRRSPACAVCHVRMDPLGFSLENFDALGKWRTESDGGPVDASALLPDGTTFHGVAGLRQLLASRQPEFVQTFVEKLLAYALGRAVGAGDQPAVRAVVRDSARDGYRWSAVIRGVVTSVPFTMGLAATPQTADPAGAVAVRSQSQEPVR